MNLASVRFSTHDACEAMAAAIANLPEADRRAKRKRYRTGECIWGAADLPRNVYLLTAGGVEVSTYDKNGRQLIVERVEPGQVFGYLCFCTHRNEPLATEARATQPSQTVRTSADDFARALKRDERLSDLLAQSLCTRAAQAQARLNLLLVRDARLRLLTLLLQMAEAKAQSTPGTRNKVSLYVSHAELAAAACLTRAHVTTIMTRLRESRLIDYRRGSAVELSLQRLQAAVEA